ncbi:hypothetical protein [Chroococcidiopsis sp. CCNUC1]|uniref:hypothetical protein n=1 Tax=Chroococcidiopsis sp. CCNUC1 TaxID=2653189 RepID=UPI00202145AF|nr:hypothetical protein [Chroococcidiopsis sp. CCNUC1]URD48491.1 hypothetical protein M5J74_19365 [Chroococcidiopsis sp. CCNUC1]
MLSAKQDQIEFLKQELADEIARREKVTERTVPSYICINNLKSKLNRLKEIAEILSIEKYKLVFIGTIGEGKTTAICHLFNLIGDFKVSKTIAGKAINVTEVQELLATGSGKTTICEVIIEAAAKTYIEIEPYSLEQMESMIVEFCESLADSEDMQGEPKVMISKEIETAIRNVIDLNKVSETTTEGDKRQTLRIDRAKEELEKSGIDGLKDIALRNADLKNRVSTKIEFTSDEDERTWIKRTFALINSAKLKEFAIPRKIRIYVSDRILSGSNLFQFQAVIDTKGIDENPIRKDLQEYIEGQDSICLFTTHFKDAPETNIRELMRYYLSSKSRDFHYRFVTLVITHKGEPERVNGNEDGTWELGTEIRREDIQSTFKNLNLEFFPENIIFYDALRYYNSEIAKLSDLYTEDDVQQDRNACIQSIASVIERRQKILQDEVEAIKNSFQKIKAGETLTDKELEAIKDAIQKIKNLRALGSRVPSFVYEEFINNFISYYHNNYRAWNTKHAIHRNFGFYAPRNIDIYYDARIVAEGFSEDEMLRKFTKEVKEDLEEILNNLKVANEALETFIPELLVQLDTYYDDFIEKVGLSVEEFLYQEKLAPQSNNSDFWTALINEKGKPRPKGEKYNDNVCQTLRRELESDYSLNLFLKDRAKEYWAELIGKVLQFFGEK